MASSSRVRSKLQEMIDRLGKAPADVRRDLARALPKPRRVQIEVTDLRKSYWTDLARGKMGPLQEGPAPERADITLRGSSDDLIAMVDGKANLLSMYLRGKVRIDASLSDLMALRKMA